MQWKIRITHKLLNDEKKTIAICQHLSIMEGLKAN